MINEQNEDDYDHPQRSPEPSLKQRKPLITTDLSVDSATQAATSSVENLYKEGDLDPVYHAKTLVLNRALQEIGMGRYQVKKKILYAYDLIMCFFFHVNPSVDIIFVLGHIVASICSFW